MNNKELNLVYRITEYGMNNEPFSAENLYKALQLNDLEQEYVRTVLMANGTIGIQPNHILILVSNSNSNRALDFQYRVLPTAIYSYTDHLEIVEARKTAKNSFIISLLAIGISIVLGIFQIILAR